MLRACFTLQPSSSEGLGTLNADASEEDRGMRRRHKAIIDRLEDMLVRPQRIGKVCAVIGVSEQTLRAVEELVAACSNWKGDCYVA